MLNEREDERTAERIRSNPKRRKKKKNYRRRKKTTELNVIEK